MTEQRHARPVDARPFIKGALVFVALAICAALVLMATGQTQKPFNSAEVGFTDPSAHGMQIVPASCPSNPGDAEAPYGCSGSTPLCPDGVSAAPNAVLADCTCAEGNTNACMSCSVGISPNPSAYAYTGTPVTLTWSSSANTSQVYINNIGWVVTSGSTQVASKISTDYSCYSYNPTWGNSGWYGYTLSVTPPAAPGLTISANPTTIVTGQTSTISATYAPGSGDADTGTQLDITVPGGSPTLIPGYGTTPVPGYTYLFTPSSPGTYAFTPWVTTSYYTGWSNYSHSVSVTVTQGAACTISLSPTSITNSQSSTLTYSSTNAAAFSINNVGSIPPNTSGSTTVAPSQSTDYTGTVISTGGGVTQTATITASGNWTVPANVTKIDALIVAGGGSGSGGAEGGGGGGGGVLRLSGVSVTPGAVLAVTVGAGGASGASGANGGNSSISGVGTAIGGGGGGGESSSGTAGGSGGGAGGSAGSGGAGTSGQGNAGAVGSGATRHAGGGGGAATAGVAGSSGGAGGSGLVVSSEWGGGTYAGGGGGSAETAFGAGVGGAGGSGGGGHACGSAGNTDSNGIAGTANTGGGGGAGGRCGGGGTGGLVGGAGGSGIVIITYTPGLATTCTAPGTSPAGTLTVSCAPTYSCSGSTLQFTNSSCQTTTVAACTGADQYCQSGVAQCQYYPIANNESTGKYLQIAPSLVQPGESTKLFWNVSDAQSCSVSGSNGDFWTGLASPNGGQASKGITAQTFYTLVCKAFGGNSNATDTETVSVTPQYHEQ